MSVIVETETGWLLDHHAYSVCRVSEGSTGNLCTRYQMRRSLFDIVSPFVMDSQFRKTGGHFQSEMGEGCVTNKKRKRKRKEPLNIGELRAEEFHQQVKSHICQAHTSFLEAGTQSGYFLLPDGTQPNDNNMASRSAAAMQGARDMFAGLLVGTGADCTESWLPLRDIYNGLALRSADIVNGVWQHKGKHSAILYIDDQPFIIPHECTFILGEMSQLTIGAPVLGTFDLLVLDPPWESKSVKRLKKYNMLGNTELLAVPLEQLMSPGCLVVVWVTNRQKHRDFVTRQLFPRKHITHLATWCWLKVTRTGKPVRAIDDRQKRPYEVLLLGRYADSRELVWHDREPVRHDSDKGLETATNSADDLRDSPYKEAIKMKANLTSETDFLRNGSHETQIKKHCTMEGCSMQRNFTIMDSGLGDELEEKQTDLGFVTDKQYVEPAPERFTRVSDEHISGSKCLKDTGLHATVDIPDNRVIVSVPCSLHSKKPPLYDVLKLYLAKDARCCEMFARNLQPGWTSWGNEVLIHQHLDYYESVT
ncbi:N(6)-adenine-specific methyltransferase METTL4-like [Dreissena polymorpha]|nr:N(6)-adenine-specific methyltransferase METTL4-like [Dreissena polymorpha]KAH3694540.1 hypothetical protein DPMN_081979 [Dreissena polymorpha]